MNYIHWRLNRGIFSGMYSVPVYKFCFDNHAGFFLAKIYVIEEVLIKDFLFLTMRKNVHTIVSFSTIFADTNV